MKTNSKNFSSLENALRLLELFTIAKPEMSVREIAKELSVAESTAHRLLSTLKKEGFVVKDSYSNKYRLGVFLRYLETVLIKDFKLYQISSSVLKDLSKKTEENASICILFRNRTFYLNTIESPNSIYDNLIYPGKLQSLSDTSAGKIFALSSTYHDEQLQNAERELSMLMKNGYLISHNNFSSGLSSIASPVKNSHGEIVAAIELLGPEQRISRKANKYIEYVKEASYKIERMLNY